MNEAEPLIRLGSTHACTTGVVRSIIRSAVVSTLAYFVVAVCVAVMVVVPASPMGVTWPVEVTVANVAGKLS